MTTPADALVRSTMDYLTSVANDHKLFMRKLADDPDMQWDVDTVNKFPFEHSISVSLLEDLQNFAFVDTDMTMRVSARLVVLREEKRDSESNFSEADQFEGAMRQAFKLSDTPGVRPGEGPNWSRRVAKLKPPKKRSLCKICNERVADIQFTPCMHTLYCITCVSEGNLAMLDGSPYCYICIIPSAVVVHPDASCDPLVEALTKQFDLSVSMSIDTTKTPNLILVAPTL